MKKIIWVFGFSLVLIACNNNPDNSAIEADDTTLSVQAASADTLSEGCYSQIHGRDTASLQIQAKGSQVSGSLSYNIFEKDRNDGTIQADMTGDIIRGWYLFKSEGIISVREVAWKVNGDELWPASGEIKQAGDTTRFANPNQLQFDDKNPFKKIPCTI